MHVNFRLALIAGLAIVALAVATEVSPLLGLILLIPALSLCWQQFSSEAHDKRKMYHAYRQGEDCLNHGDFAQAIEAFDSIFDIANARLWVFGEFDALAETYGSRGYAYHQMGDEANATTDYRQAHRLKPQLKARQLYQGALQSSRGNSRDAIANFDRAIRFSPHSPDSYFYRGVEYFRAGDDEKAFTDLSHAIALDAHYSSEVYNLRGVIHLYKGDPKGALTDFVQAIALKPTARQYWNLSIAQQQLNLHSEREASLDEAIKLDKNYVAAYYCRGNIHHYTGDIEGAHEDFLYAKEREDKRIASVDSQDVQGLYERGFARHHMGNMSGAIADLKRAKELCEKYRYHTFLPSVEAALAEIAG